jgi:hypothetical protein
MPKASMEMIAQKGQSVGSSILNRYTLSYEAVVSTRRFEAALP